MCAHDRSVDVLSRGSEGKRQRQQELPLSSSIIKLSQTTTHLAKLEQYTARIEAMHVQSGGVLVQLMAMVASLQKPGGGGGGGAAQGEGRETAVVTTSKTALEGGANEATDATEAAAFAASVVVANPCETNATLAPLAVAESVAIVAPPPRIAEMDATDASSTTVGGILPRDTSAPDHLGHTCGAMFCDDLFRESMKDGGCGSRLPTGMLGNASEARKERSRAASCISFFLHIAKDEEKQFLGARTPTDTTERMRVEGERKKVVQRLHTRPPRGAHHRGV